MHSGTIHKAMSGFYYVNSAGGIHRCVARGRFRHDNNSPLVGDKVVFDITGPGEGVLTDILPRRNVFVRPPLANIDVMVIVASGAIPVTDPYLIDKMTVIALTGECKPVICINKLDIDEADELYSIYKTTGFPVVRTSATCGDGIDELLAVILQTAAHECNGGVICAFCGNSGVGKSSILNAIDNNFDISTGEVSKRLGRGRHTTRHIELYELSGGILVADTPGFSSFETGNITAKEDLQYVFPEFEPFIRQCRFDDCAHLSEPGCSVLDAVNNGLIHSARHDSYRRLYKQASEYKAWE